ncbi:MAG: hypothetical protein K6G56_08020 [Clostridiales bacterium]|nr:hypothetical protein [Clostridiales bacterium]
MRNALSELPILLFCVRGGLAAGAVCFLLRLPRRLYLRSLRGRRARFLPVLFGWLTDALAAAASVGLFALTLLFANGGELRLYAVCGFFAGMAAAYLPLDTLLFKR